MASFGLKFACYANSNKKASLKYANDMGKIMDLLDYVAEQIKKGKKPGQIRELLVQNGYPVYEVENALSVAETKDEKGGKKAINVSVNAPGYMIILVMSAILLIAGVVTLILYFV